MSFFKRKIILLIPCLVFSVSIFSQGKLKGAEYFWNTDPGEGSGEVMNAVDGQFNSGFEQAIKSAIISPPNSGLNLFCVRFKDSSGTWGPVFKRTIFAEQSPRNIKVSLGEFFWDTDPGLGSGTSFAAFDGAFDSAIETIFNSSLNLPSQGGLHIFSLRIKDENSLWGPVFKRTIATEDSPRNIKITSAEYYWGDTDPGEGSGTVLVAFDGSFSSAIETAFNSALAVAGLQGTQLFNLRIRDENGNWGPIFKRTIAIQDSPRNIKITSAEYFWGITDPGEGSGTSMIAFDGNFDSAIETVLKNSLSTTSLLGVQIFNIRVQDENNSWGPLFKKAIAIQDSPREIKVTAAEYFWDTDPGEGSANVMLAFDGFFNDAVESVLKNSLNTPTTGGIHSFNIRIKDENNNWGPVFSKSISIEDSPRNIKINAAEYFWGSSDPGQGNGTTMVAFDGAYDKALETAFSSPSSPPSNGLNLFNIRIKDADNLWGPLFKRTVYVSYGGGTITWTGAFDDDWHKACNWSPEEVPDCTHPVYIPLTSNNPNITAVANCNILNIETDNGAILYIQSDAGATLNIDDCSKTRTINNCQ